MPSLELSEIKTRLKTVGPLLADEVAVELIACEREGRTLHVALTERFRKQSRKARMWASKGMLTALKNAAYGFDPAKARSRGGADGIFIVDRDFKPTNTMIKRLFDGFLDKESKTVEAIAAHVGADPNTLEAVRLVSHHTRLLGVLAQLDDRDHLILVDVDPSKRA